MGLTELVMAAVGSAYVILLSWELYRRLHWQPMWTVPTFAGIIGLVMVTARAAGADVLVWPLDRHSWIEPAAVAVLAALAVASFLAEGRTKVQAMLVTLPAIAVAALTWLPTGTGNFELRADPMQSLVSTVIGGNGRAPFLTTVLGQDGLATALLYVPLGLAVGAVFGRRGRLPSLIGMTTLAILTAVIQALLTNREPSIAQVLMAIVGGTAGLVLVTLVSARPAPSPHRRSAQSRRASGY